MEQEACFSGYCRQTDQSRMVFCQFLIENGQTRLIEADCAYPTCKFAPECQLAAQFQAHEKAPAAK